MELLKFIFSSFWHFIGFAILFGMVLRFIAIIFLGAIGKMTLEDLEEENENK